MAIVFGILCLIILLYIVPTLIGSCFVAVDKKAPKLPFWWICGQLVLWAGFQLLCVPLILRGMEFDLVVYSYTAYILFLLGMAAVLGGWRKRKSSLRLVREGKMTFNKWYMASWVIFLGLLLFQLYQAVALAYADGDDAYYVAMSGMAENSGRMYEKIPYTGWPSELDVRHGMAPFPIWIAYLARISGIKVVSVNHIAMPLMLIPMTYAVYYLLACRFCARKKEWVPVFLVFTEVLVLFGDYSLYTVERFMIARSRQGKAALGNIIIPILFLLLLILLEKLEENQRLKLNDWILLASAMTAGCLCSTLGALLVCMLIGITGICAAFCYKRWRFLFPMATCCIPCVAYAGLYLVLG